MADWTLIAAVGAGAVLILSWMGLEERRRQWKRTWRRRRCSHPSPCLDGRYRSREPGWARDVFYCPDCKDLWARRVPVTADEWTGLAEAQPTPSLRADRG